MNLQGEVQYLQAICVALGKPPGVEEIGCYQQILAYYLGQ